MGSAKIKRTNIMCTCIISIGNHMNSSAIWEIIALSHVLEGRVITRGEAEWNFPSNTWRVQLFPKLHENTCDYLLII